MFETSLQGLRMLCDQCNTVLSIGGDLTDNRATWERVESRRKGKGAGRGRNLDFCDEKCRIIFLRGKKYYARKLQHIADNDKKRDGN